MTEYQELRIHNISSQKKRLSYLAYLLNAGDACTAVAFFEGKFYVSNNYGSKRFVKRLMRFLKDFQALPNDRIWIQRRKEELLEMIIKKRIDRYKKGNKYLKKLKDVKDLKSSISGLIPRCEEFCKFQSNQSEKDKIQTII